MYMVEESCRVFTDDQEPVERRIPLRFFIRYNVHSCRSVFTTTLPHFFSLSNCIYFRPERLIRSFNIVLSSKQQISRLTSSFVPLLNLQVIYGKFIWVTFKIISKTNASRHKSRYLYILFLFSRVPWFLFFYF